MASTLPLSQTITYVDGVTEIAAEDMNAISAGLVAAHHGSIVVPLGFLPAHVSLGSFTRNGVGSWLSVGAGDWIDIDINLPVDTTVTNIDVFVSQAGATPIAFQFGYVDGLNENFVATVTEAGNATTGYKTISKDMSAIADSLRKINASRIYKLRVKSTSQAGDILKFAELTCQKTA